MERGTERGPILLRRASSGPALRFPSLWRSMLLHGVVLVALVFAGRIALLPPAAEPLSVELAFLPASQVGAGTGEGAPGEATPGPADAAASPDRAAPQPSPEPAPPEPAVAETPAPEPELSLIHI